MNNEEMWSIKLGHSGLISNEFKEHYDKVIKVRKHIRNEIVISFVCFAIFNIIYLFFNSDNIFLNTFLYVLIFISIFSILAHSRVVYQWKKHDKKMVKEWEEKKMNITRTPEGSKENQNP